MTELGLGATAILGVIGWIIKGLISRTMHVMDDEIKLLKEKVEVLEEHKSLGKLDDDNREAHKDIWIEFRKQGNALSKMQGKMGMNGNE